MVTVEPWMVAVTAAVGLLIAVAVMFMLRFRTRKPRDTVLLVGPSGAGKTALYYRLKADRFWETVTSSMVNEGKFEPAGAGPDQRAKPSWFVDVPGHESLRAQMHARLSAGTARRVLFVMDSSTVLQRPREAAEVLFDVLTSRALRANRVPVLIACNKSDVPQSIPVERVRTVLEQELTRLRGTRAAMADTAEAGAAGDAVAVLGGDGPFSFDRAPLPVSFCAVSAATGAGMDTVRKFAQ